MEFNVLGPLEVTDGTQVMDLRGPRQKALLAVLLLHRNRVVSSELLIDRVWQGRPPRAAERTLRSDISRLRQKVDPEHRSRGDRGVLITKKPGYMLRVEPSQLDFVKFQLLMDEGQEAFKEGDARRAVEALEAGLALWRGSPFQGCEYCDPDGGTTMRLNELGLIAREELMGARLALGKHREVVAELRDLIAQDPLRERPWAQLMIALYRSRRQTEALQAYLAAKKHFFEVGLEPGSMLKQLEQSILMADPSLDLVPHSEASADYMRTRVFISYVREDSVAVDRIAAALRDAAAEVWLDRTSLVGGDPWELRIRRAIRDGDYFVACFSPASVHRERSYMRTELLIAIEELRLRPQDGRWFIPVVLGDCSIPDYPIGGGQTLQKFHYLDFSQDWDAAIRQLLRAVSSDDSNSRSHRSRLS